MLKPYLELGQIVTTHGVTGEVKLYPWCDGPDFVAALPRVFFGPHGEQEMKLLSVRAQKDMCILRLEGVNTMEAARALMRKTLWCARADAPLPAGRCFVQDILGCTVRDADTDAVYGTVTDVTHPGASDIYTVKNEAGQEFLFPAVPAFLVSVSPAEGTVLVRPIPGMFTQEGENADAD